jgi:hypothetical protein
MRIAACARSKKSGLFASYQSATAISQNELN